MERQESINIMIFEWNHKPTKEILKEMIFYGKNSWEFWTLDQILDDRLGDTEFNKLFDNQITLINSYELAEWYELYNQSYGNKSLITKKIWQELHRREENFKSSFASLQYNG